MSRIVAFFFAIFLVANLMVGLIGWVLPGKTPPFVDQTSECVGPQWACLVSHVHTPNRMILALPSFTGGADPFTTTSLTPVALPGLLATIKQQNATHGVWLLVMAQLTVRITAGGIGNIQLECDGASCGSGGTFSNAAYMSLTIILMQNNTFTDNAVHTIGVDISSDSALHTINVCAIDTECFATGLGNYVSALSVADLSSSGPQ